MHKTLDIVIPPSDKGQNAQKVRVCLSCGIMTCAVVTGVARRFDCLLASLLNLPLTVDEPFVPHGSLWLLTKHC